MENIPAQFSRQTTRLQFPKDVHWGDDITIWISKVGDLAHSMYLRVTWPDDAPTTVQPSTGTAMIDRIELSYKDQLIERIYGENLYMLGDIKIPQAKQSALSNMVGTSTTTALSSYHIPLPFLILKKGIPLIALKEAPKFRVVFNPSSTFTTSLYIKPIQVDLFVDYIYVSKPERDWFVKNELVYLTHSFQRLQFSVPQSDVQTTYTYYTEFVNDVKELFWVIQSDAASNVYDYGNHLVNLQLTLNNQDFITNDYATAQYLHVLQPLQFHTRVPSGNYYMYSFALEPESDQPTGEMNMTNITRQQHSLTLTASPSETRNLRIYAHAYNLFRIKDGDGTTAFPLREGGAISSAEVKNPPPPPPPPPPEPGTVQWATRIAGTSFEFGQSISVDISGNSYVTGPYTSSPVTIYNSDGNTYGTLTNDGGNDTYIVKYNTSGTAQWATRIAGTGSDVGSSISVDSSGNSYVTGYYYDSPLTIYNSDGTSFGTLTNDGSNDSFIVKYDADGTAQWATRIAGTNYDTGASISVDGSGNSYVIGYYTSSPVTIYNSDGTSFGTLTNDGSNDSFIVKYDADGTAQWATRIGDTGSDFGSSISVDSSGNSYVTGPYTSSPVTIYNSDGSTYGTLTNSGFYDAYIVKYNTSGTAQWATRIAGTNYDIGTSISVDGSGNSYVTGQYYSSPVTIYNSDGSTYGTLTNEGWYDVYIVKYDADGTAQWATHIGGSTDHSYGASISVDSSGNSYVTGHYYSSPVTIYNSDGSTYGTLTNDGSNDSFIVKYDADGTVQWATRIGDTGSDTGASISVDSSGNSYVTGHYTSSPVTIYNSDGSTYGTLTNDGDNDTFIVKYA
jgi:hypothetical protein